MDFDAPPVFVGLLWTAFSGYMLWHALLSRRRATASATWPQVTGTVTNSDAVQWTATSPHTSWLVEYAYTVGGESYEGNQPAFYSLPREDIVALGDRYAEGAPISVYYDPQEPSTSVLVRGEEAGVRNSGVILGAVAMLIGLALTAASLLATA